MFDHLGIYYEKVYFFNGFLLSMILVYRAFTRADPTRTIYLRWLNLQGSTNERGFAAFIGTLLSAGGGRNAFMGGKVVFMYFTIQSNLAIVKVSSMNKIKKERFGNFLSTSPFKIGAT